MKKKILIVEDEFEIGEAVKLILEDEGYETFLVKDGKEALELLSKIPIPHLILSDIMMPKMDGYQLLEQLSHNENFRKIPFIFMSAGNPRESQARWDAFLKKPFNIDELIALVHKIMTPQGGQPDQMTL